MRKLGLTCCSRAHRVQRSPPENRIDIFYRWGAAKQQLPRNHSATKQCCSNKENEKSNLNPDLI